MWCMGVCHDMPFEPVTNNDTKEIFCNHCLIDIQEEIIVGGTGVNLSKELWINVSLGNLLNAIFIDQLKLCHKGLVMSYQSKGVVNKTLSRVTEVLEGKHDAPYQSGIENSMIKMEIVRQPQFL